MKTPHKRSILSAVLQQTTLQGQILLHVQGLGVPSCCHGQAATFSLPQPNFLPPQKPSPDPSSQIQKATYTTEQTQEMRHALQITLPALNIILPCIKCMKKILEKNMHSY